MGQHTGSLQQGAAGTLRRAWTQDSHGTSHAAAPQTRLPARPALSIVGEPPFCCQSNFKRSVMAHVGGSLPRPTAQCLGALGAEVCT